MADDGNKIVKKDFIFFKKNILLSVLNIHQLRKITIENGVF